MGMDSDIDVGSDGEAAIAPPPITTPVKTTATRARTPSKTKCYLCEGSGKPIVKTYQTCAFDLDCWKVVRSRLRTLQKRSLALVTAAGELMLLNPAQWRVGTLPFKVASAEERRAARVAETARCSCKATEAAAIQQ